MALRVLPLNGVVPLHLCVMGFVSTADFLRFDSTSTVFVQPTAAPLALHPLDAVCIRMEDSNQINYMLFGQGTFFSLTRIKEAYHIYIYLHNILREGQIYDTFFSYFEL